MRASWTFADRSGVGALAAFVIWVVTIALIYAFMLSQGQSGALTGIVRVSGLRTVTFVGQSAIAEASYVLRHPPKDGSIVLENIRNGGTDGFVHDPAATKQLYADDIATGRLEIGPVDFTVARRPAKEGDPYQIDLHTRITTRFAGVKITRVIRRRVLGELCQVRALLGPSRGQVVLATLALQDPPLFEVIEP